ncbi:hypothetical protein G3U99_19020 [Vibrio coralliilyticus OCN008]|uniref:hypothetical protein n=1 Tax=Vibrio coralliilyticus TaxID=190893 RepID=UPI000390B8B0|nr:hypothetical protein [Vibrio coralliilyticus]ERB63416.1 hypothetical protein N779_20940 [Vibrio coralliilyticus OCN008]QIJ86359.1 hypothetical protein G3U99_19020 [Vibrio coralliilyticus OCN008]
MPKNKGKQSKPSPLIASSTTESTTLEEKIRPLNHEIYETVKNFSTTMAYVAHWYNPITNDAIPIAPVCDGAGLEKNPSNHPDQTFWNQKLKPRPSNDYVIVTDCKLLPCEKTMFTCCKHSVPKKIGKELGPDIPIAVFAHNDLGDHIGHCYYTRSDANPHEVDEIGDETFSQWEWDEE